MPMELISPWSHTEKNLIKLGKLDFVYTVYIFVHLLALLRQRALLLYCWSPLQPGTGTLVANQSDGEERKINQL